MLPKQPSIDILLATYKGEENLTEQVDSLLKQTYKNYNLIIRDDDSDNCITENIKALSGEIRGKVSILDDQLGQLGTLGNFSRLLAESESDYIMFCDQDDVWDPTKIEITLSEMLRLEEKYGSDVPLLVHTDAKVVTDRLEVISESLWKHQNIHPRNREKFNRLIVQNIVTGCTVMINKALRDLASPIPDNAVMHDWWLALVASAFGKIGHVDKSTMCYRQHADNKIGAKYWGVHFVLKTILGNDGQVSDGIQNTRRQARAFLDVYQRQIPKDIKDAVECYANIDQHTHLIKVYLLIKHRLFKAGPIRNIGLWAHI